MVALLPRLRRYAYTLTSSREDADDLVQAACERALSRRHQWQTGTRLDSWMFRIIYTIRVDGIRSLQSRGVHVSMEEDFRQTNDGCKEDLEAKLMLQRVLQAMKQLSDSNRQILALVCIDGLSYKDTAETLQVPIGTVMSRLARARRKLYELAHGSNELKLSTQGVMT